MDSPRLCWDPRWYFLKNCALLRVTQVCTMYKWRGCESIRASFQSNLIVFEFHCSSTWFFKYQRSNVVFSMSQSIILLFFLVEWQLRSLSDLLQKQRDSYEMKLKGYSCGKTWPFRLLNCSIKCKSCLLAHRMACFLNYTVYEGLWWYIYLSNWRHRANTVILKHCSDSPFTSCQIQSLPTYFIRSSVSGN